MGYLNKINQPSDIKKLSRNELKSLAKELRSFIIDSVSNRHHPIAFAIRQFVVCGVFSLITAVIMDERLLITAPIEWFYIFINGFLAIALGYTFQIYGQKITPPSQAALIFSTEAVFAAGTGYLFLNEVLGPQALVGCVLMFGGSLMAQFYPPLNHKPHGPKELP